MKFTVTFGLFLIAVLLLSFPVSALADLELSDGTCVDGTNIEFKIKNKGNDPVPTSDLKVDAHYFSSFSVKVDERGLDKEFKFTVPGGYSTDRVPAAEEQLYPVRFTSSAGQFTYPGVYKVYLTYSGCKESYGKCVTSMQISCKGLPEYGCAAIPLMVDSCENSETDLQLTFHNVKKGLLSTVDPKKDLEFIFFGKSYHIQNDLPEGTVLKETSSDHYTLSFPQIQDNYIDRVKLHSKICGYELYSNCKAAASNDTFVDDTSIFGTETTNQTLSDESSFDFTSNAIYYISILFVIIIIFIIYTIKKVRI